MLAIDQPSPVEEGLQDGLNLSEGKGFHTPELRQKQVLCEKGVALELTQVCGANTRIIEAVSYGDFGNEYHIVG